jgi:hypothetical protein
MPEHLGKTSLIVQITENNMNIADFEKKVNFLLTKRKMMPSKKIGLKAWCKYFLAFAWTEHCKCGDGHEMLDILLNEDNLIGGEKFNTTFILKFEDLYPEALKNNKTWQRLLPALVGFKGKGLGVGELYLALVIQGWTIERTGGKGDGKVAGGSRELKNNGASLKPLANALRIQDYLNLTVFAGHRAGPIKETKRTKGQSFDKWLLWFDTNTNKKEILLTYFTQLYPGRDVNAMCDALVVAKDGKEFNMIIGKEVLKWYKEVDKWASLIIIDQKKMMICNIADVGDLSMFKNIKFEWKSERGDDSQAISDGYVNISI